MEIVLTGGHSGMGLELSKLLLADGHRLTLIVRSAKRKEGTLQALGASEEQVRFHYADLSVQAQVRKVGAEIVASGVGVDGLFNNAGVLTDKSYRSAQDNEMHYEVNTLAPYLLTSALWPALEQSAAPFVVNTATGSMDARDSIDMQELKAPIKFRKLLGSYVESKVAMIVLMNHLAETLQASNLLMTHVNPGSIKTKMTSGEGMPWFLKPLRAIMFSEPIVGAKRLYAGSRHEESRGKGGVLMEEKGFFHKEMVATKLKPMPNKAHYIQELLLGIQNEDSAQAS